MKTFFAAVVALSAAQPAWAESWRVVGYGGEAPLRAVFLVDTDSIVRQGDTVRFRSSTVWESYEDDNDFNKSITQRLGDCSTKASAILINDLFADGNLLRTDDESGEMITHGPDSLMRGVLDAVCGDAGYESDAVENYEPAIRQWFAENP
jgi:hypothetical protein